MGTLVAQNPLRRRISAEVNSPLGLIRFWSKVMISDGCWDWVGAKTAKSKSNPFGYGCGMANKKHYYAHIESYRMLCGEIKAGLEIDHLCHNTLCVNPYHLEPKTHLGNMLNSSPAIRTHCKRGHERNESTMAVRPDGSAYCRPCASAMGLANYHSKRGR